MCSKHRHISTCQNQHRQNETAGQVDIPTWEEDPVTGDPGDMCRDHKDLTTCQKQHRQNESSWSGRHSYQGGGPLFQKQHGQIPETFLPGRSVGRSWTHVGTTVSPPVKNNTDRMNQLVR